MRHIRAFFEDPLFVKTPSGMEPTPKAAMLGASIVDVMATLRQDVISRARVDPSGRDNSSSVLLNATLNLRKDGDRRQRQGRLQTGGLTSRRLVRNWSTEVASEGSEYIDSL